MRILVTGGCGFLGSHIVEHLIKTVPEAAIVILDKLTYASSGLDRLRDILLGDGTRAIDRVRVLGCDLSQPIPAGVTEEVGAIDYVIHTAAETHVDNSILDPLPFYQSNVIGTHHLLWWVRAQLAIRRVFLISTDEVYGPAGFWQEPESVDERAPFRPANPYAAAKAGGEAIGMAYANTYKLPITIVNTMNLYGERQHVEKFIPKTIRAVLTQTVLPIHADPTRTQPGQRFYIHCRNFASALVWMIEWDYRARANALGNGRDPDEAAMQCMPLKIHIAGERELSNLELAKMIAGFVGMPLRYELVDFHSSRPGHDLRYVMSDAAARRLGWSQPLNTEQSLERVVRWYLDPAHQRKWLGIPT